MSRGGKIPWQLLQGQGGGAAAVFSLALTPSRTCGQMDWQTEANSNFQLTLKGRAGKNVLGWRDSVERQLQEEKPGLSGRRLFNTPLLEGPAPFTFCSVSVLVIQASLYD